MPGDADATRRRILDAATREFSAHGIAGARVDRIADDAGSNKAMIYRYFGSKDALFEAVFEAVVVQTADDVPIDPDDLPGYAVRLYDRHREQPAPLRIGTWDWLERRGAGMAGEAVRRAAAGKVAVIADAQARGTIGAALPPTELMTMILVLSRAGLAYGVPPDVPEDVAAQREAIRTAVALLVG